MDKRIMDNKYKKGVKMICPKCGKIMKYDIKNNEYYCEIDGTIEENEAFDEGFMPNSQFSSGFSLDFSQMTTIQRHFNDFLTEFLNFSYFSSKNYKQNILFQFKNTHFLDDFYYQRQTYNEKLAILLIKTYVSIKNESQKDEIFSKIFEDYLKFVKFSIENRVKTGENSVKSSEKSVKKRVKRV